MTRLHGRKYRRLSRRALRRLKKADMARVDLWWFLYKSPFQSDVDAARILNRASIENAKEEIRRLNDLAEASRKEGQR